MNDEFEFPPGRNVRDTQDHDVALIEASLKYWCAQDVEATLSTYADDIVYHVYTFQQPSPQFAELSGKQAVRTLLYDILAGFDYLSYASDLLELREGVARVQTRFVLRHRESGESLSGSKRQRVYIANGEIVRIDEYHDVAMVDAFMRLTKIALG